MSRRRLCSRGLAGVRGDLLYPVGVGGRGPESVRYAILPLAEQPELIEQL
jgi:hypothetical protein